MRAIHLKACDGRIHPDVWTAVHRHAAQTKTSLFPNLTHLLSFELYQDFPMECLPHLLPPTLRYLRLDFGRKNGTGDKTVEGVLREMRSRVLRGLHALTVGFQRDYMARASKKEIEDWDLSNLQALAIRHGVVWDHRRVQALAKLPNLSSLELTVNAVHGVSHEAIRGFNRLQKLDLYAHCDHAAIVLSSITSTVLQDIALRLRVSFGDDPLPHFQRALSLLPPTSLIALKISMEEVIMTGTMPISTIIAPLHHCTRLRHFSLVCFLNVDLNDGDLHSMSDTWPLLTSFNLLGTFDHSIAPPSITDVAAFAQAHPQLTHLDLPFIHVPAEMLTDSGVELLPVLDHGLQTLTFGSCSELPESPVRMGAVEDPDFEADENRAGEEPRLRLSNVFRFAILLDRLFPRLDRRGKGARGESMGQQHKDFDAALFIVLQALQRGREGVHRRSTSRT